MEGVRGYGHIGDIAIDDVALTVGACDSVAHKPADKCGFEHPLLCGWDQVSSCFINFNFTNIL